MKNLTHYSESTPENSWAEFQESRRYLMKLQAETEKQRKENDRYLKEQFAETDKRFKETENLIKENIRSIKEIKKITKETALSMKDTDERMKETDRRMKDLQQTLGGWANNHGSVAEEYFFNSFEKGQQNFFGEKFDEIEKNVKGIKKGYRDEYDILLINGKSIGIIEVKYKAHENDVSKVLKKAETFRLNFQEYKHHKIYLGLATMAFYPILEQKCIQEGIAIIKQVGDNVVITDAHLKVF